MTSIQALSENHRKPVTDVKKKWKAQAERVRKAITKVVAGGGLSRSSDEVFVMNMERRA